MESSTIALYVVRISIWIWPVYQLYPKTKTQVGNSTSNKIIKDPAGNRFFDEMKRNYIHETCQEMVWFWIVDRSLDLSCRNFIVYRTYECFRLRKTPRTRYQEFWTAWRWRFLLKWSVTHNFNKSHRCSIQLIIPSNYRQTCCVTHRWGVYE